MHFNQGMVGADGPGQLCLMHIGSAARARGVGVESEKAGGYAKRTTEEFNLDRSIIMLRPRGRC